MVPLLALLAFLPARGACPEAPLVALESHVGWAQAAWVDGQDPRFSASHALLLEDLACLAGSGLRTRNPALFLVLARGALEAGAPDRALAAARALLVVDPDATPDPALVPPGSALAATLDEARALGPDAAGFRALYLGQASPPPPTVPAENPAVAERARLLAEVQAEIALDRRGHRAGVALTTAGGVVAGLSLAILGARATSGEGKLTAEQRAQREAMGRVWVGTAVAGGATLGFGLWMLRASGR